MQRVTNTLAILAGVTLIGCNGLEPPEIDLDPRCEGESCLTYELDDGGTPDGGQEGPIEEDRQALVSFPAVNLGGFTCGGFAGRDWSHCVATSCDDCRRRGFFSDCSTGNCMWCESSDPGCGSLGGGSWARDQTLDFPGDGDDWVCDLVVVTGSYESPGQDQCDEHVNIRLDGTDIDGTPQPSVEDKCNDSGSGPLCDVNRRGFCPHDAQYTTRFTDIPVADPVGTDVHRTTFEFPGGSVNVVSYQLVDCERVMFCGDGRVDPGEQCDPPGDDSTQCPQETSGCDGTRFWRRDGYGSCDDGCGCVPDPVTPECVAGQCGAECGPPGEDSADCPQETSGCIGPRYWERDAHGDCSSDCGCTQDPIEEECVPGQCGAVCADSADCDDGDPSTTDTCNGECGCDHAWTIDLGCMPDEPTANGAALAEARRVIDPICPSATIDVSRSGPLCSSSFLVQARGCGHRWELTAAAKIDGTPPTISPGILAGCYPTGDAALAAARSVTRVSDDCPGPIDTEFTLDTSAGLCSASILVEATDACGNRATHRYPNVRIDAAPPVLTAGSLEACYPDEASALAAARAATSVSESCPGVTVDVRRDPATPPCDATIVVSAVDACGNVATPVRYEHLQLDSAPPVLTPGILGACFPDEASALAAARAATSVSENCPIVNVDASLDPSTGLCDATVVVTAVDACGNTATPIRYEHVKIDGTPPVLTPGTIDACFPDEASALAAAIAATTVSENCPGVVVDAALDPATGLCDATIRVTAVDACGLTATPVEYTNVVIDNSPPVLTPLPSPATFDSAMLCDPAGPYRPVASDPVRGHSKNWACFDFDDHVAVIDDCDASAEPTHLLIECDGTGMTELPLDQLDSCNPGHVVPRGDPADPTGFCVKLNGFLRPPTEFSIRYSATDTCGLSTTEDLTYTVSSFPRGGCR